MSNLHRLISVPILKKEWPCQQNNFGESTMIRYSMERSGNAWELRRGKDRDIPFVRTSVTKHQGLWGSVYSDVCVCVCLLHLQDYSSLFPLDDTQPSKLMRLLSSNEDEPVTLSSPGESAPGPPGCRREPGVYTLESPQKGRSRHATSSRKK